MTKSSYSNTKRLTNAPPNLNHGVEFEGVHGLRGAKEEGLRGGRGADEEEKSRAVQISDLGEVFGILPERNLLASSLPESLIMFLLLPASRFLVSEFFLPA